MYNNYGTINKNWGIMIKKKKIDRKYKIGNFQIF